MIDMTQRGGESVDCGCRERRFSSQGSSTLVVGGLVAVPAVDYAHGMDSMGKSSGKSLESVASV
jgi:hypothetical protein